jgi:hypothetical protein
VLDLRADGKDLDLVDPMKSDAVGWLAGELKPPC